MSNRAERRRQERMAEQAAKAEGAPPKPTQDEIVVRSVVIGADDLVHEFARLMQGHNPLAAIVLRELQQVHKVPPGTRFMLGGLVLNIAEGARASDLPGPSKIIRPDGFIPPPPKG